MPRFLKRCCRICGFEDSKTDAELIKHIDTSHPRLRFWRDEKAESESNRVLNISVQESGELESSSSVSGAVEKVNKIVKKEVVEDILRKQTQVKKKKSFFSLMMIMGRS